MTQLTEHAYQALQQSLLHNGAHKSQTANAYQITDERLEMVTNVRFWDDTGRHLVFLQKVKLIDETETGTDLAVSYHLVEDERD